MSSEDLHSVIIDTIEDCPNSSCTRDSLVTKVLKYLEIQTRGKPRENFADRVEVELVKLIADGTIEQYKAKNTRLRVN